MTNKGKSNRKESIDERIERIKKQYHGSRVYIHNSYRVETKSLITTNCWIPLIWCFVDLQDAIDFCDNETKNNRARVIKEVEVDAHTVKCEVVYEKA